MHYYKRNLGDYAKKAGRLTMLQHGAYTLLIDACYDREQFPTLEDAIDWTWASTQDELDAVKFVLTRFFTLSDDGRYVQSRIEEEIANYHNNSETNKRIAIEREAKRKDKLANRDGDSTKRGDDSTKREQTVNEAPPNQEPLTTNQEPLLKAHVASDAGRPDCPHEKIIELYHSCLPVLPAVKVWSEKRKGYLQSRWREDSNRQNLDYWKKFFEYVSESDFLCGRAGSFQADLEWLVNSSNFVKVIEGKYENRRAA